MRFGNNVNYWVKEDGLLDVSRGSTEAVRIRLSTDAQLRFDPLHSAVIIVDMQNYFGSAKLGRGTAAADLVPAIQTAVASARTLNMRVCWVNWGNRPDVANLPPNLLYTFKKGSDKPGFGEELESGLGPVLIKDSWSAELLDELKDTYQPTDWWIDKYRMSGFPDTALDSMLRTNNINTLFFAGVNTDQCVWNTWLDAANLGYDCVLLRDCTATTSPSYCYDAVVHNIARQTGLITDAPSLSQADR